jgi:hypothetical protein
MNTEIDRCLLLKLVVLDTFAAVHRQMSDPEVNEAVGQQGIEGFELSLMPNSKERMK